MCIRDSFYCGGADWDEAASAVSAALATLPRGEIDWELGTDIRLSLIHI